MTYHTKTFYYPSYPEYELVWSYFKKIVNSKKTRKHKMNVGIQIRSFIFKYVYKELESIDKNKITDEQEILFTAIQKIMVEERAATEIHEDN